MVEKEPDGVRKAIHPGWRWENTQLDGAGERAEEATILDQHELEGGRGKDVKEKE